MKVVVDSDRCQSTGFCVRIVDRVFKLDDAGGPTVVVAPDPGPELHQLVREAEVACPTSAIVVD